MPENIKDMFLIPIRMYKEKRITFQHIEEYHAINILNNSISVAYMKYNQQRNINLQNQIKILLEAAGEFYTKKQRISEYQIQSFFQLPKIIKSQQTNQQNDIFSIFNHNISFYILLLIFLFSYKLFKSLKCNIIQNQIKQLQSQINTISKPITDVWNYLKTIVYLGTGQIQSDWDKLKQFFEIAINRIISRNMDKNWLIYCEKKFLNHKTKQLFLGMNYINFYLIVQITQKRKLLANLLKMKYPNLKITKFHQLMSFFFTKILSPPQNKNFRLSPLSNSNKEQSSRTYFFPKRDF